MPQALPLLAWVGGGSAWLGAARIAIAVGSYVYSRNQAKKAQRAFASLRDQGTTVTFSDPMAVSAWIYGECRVGGTVVFAHTTGASNNELHQVIALCPHALSEIDDIYFGDEALGMPWNSGSPSNVPDVSSPYYGAVRINRKIAGGAADSELVSESGGAWTTDDKMTGIASIYPKTVWDVDVYPQGLSFNISADVKGKTCYDPRDSSTAYTNNSALIERDYLVNFCGYPESEIDDDDVIAAANICDESVTIADATTQARYTFNGRILTDTKPADGRQMIARSMAGWCAKIGGKWRMKAGAHQSSSLSLTQSDFRGGIEIVNQDDVSEACNAVRVTYLDPKNNWQPAVAPLVRKIVTAPNITAGARCTIVSVGSTSFTSIGAASNTVGVTFTASGAGTGTGTVDPYRGEDNGIEHIRDIDLFGVTDEARALRIGRIELERSRHGLMCVAPCNLRAMLCQAGDYVDVTDSVRGWTSKLFEVVEHNTVFEARQEGIAIGVDLALREVSSAIFSRTAADETTADPSPNTDVQNPRDVVTPVLGTLESDDDQLIIDSRGTVISRIKVPWTCADEYVLSGGTFELEYKLSADADWLPAPIAPPKGSDEVAWIGPVVDGEDYDVRIRAVNGLGVHSDWGTETAHTVIGKSDPPAAPTSFTATAIAGGVLLEWVPPTDLDISGYDIYHAPTGDSIPAFPQFNIAHPSGSFVVPGLTAGEDTDFWIKSRDTSGNRSTAVGPETAAALSAASPTLMYRGEFSASEVYYDNVDIQNIVSVGSSYYKVSNPAKDGDAGSSWGTPPGANWDSFTSIPDLTSTGIILARVGYFFDTVIVGDGTANKGRIVTHGVSTYGSSTAGVFLGFDSTTPKLFVGSSSSYYLGFDGTNVETVMKTFTLKPSTSGTQLVVDTDSSFVGANPPARLTFGTMVASSDNTKTTLNFSDGGVACSTFAMVHSPAYGVTYNYGIALNTGVARFASVQIGTDCEFTRSASNTISTSDGMVIGGGINTSAVAVDNGGTFEFFAGSGNAAVYVRNQNFEVRDSGGTAKFSVASSSGNTVVAGTLAVTGAFTQAATFNSTVAITGVLTVGTSGQIDIGADCNLFRDASNRLRTNDALTVDGQLLTSGHLVVDSGGEKFKVSSANGNIFIQGVQVVSTRSTGFANQTATPAYTDLGATPTVGQLASWAAAIDGMLKHHGLTST